MGQTNHRKNILIIVISIVVITLTTATAYLLAEILPSINNPLNIGANTERLRLVYTDCADNSPFHCENINQDLGLGESVEKTFQIKNESNDELGYILYFKFLQNTFKNDELVYKIENIDTGEELIDTTPVPYREVRTANIVIKNEVKISGKSTQNYKMTVTFLNKDYNQNENIDAKYSIKLSILPVGSTLNESISNEIIARKGWNSTESMWEHSADIKKIVFEDTMNPKDTDIKYDISSAENESVMAYLVLDGEDSNKYILYIQSDGEAVANKKSSYLFSNFTNLESIENLTNLNTSIVTSMGQMFSGCSSLTTLDVSKLDTSNVTNMYGMFQSCSSLTTLDVSNFNTSNVTNMYSMFSGCSSLTTLDVSNFDTSKVTNMQYMFNACSNLTILDVSKFDTSNVTTIQGIFYNCGGLSTLNVSSFNTSKVTNMNYMFYNCSSLTTLDVSNFNTSKVTNMASMFYGCSSLTTIDVSNFNTSKITSMNAMFHNCSNLTSLNLSNWDVSAVTDKTSIFGSISSSVQITVTNDNIKQWVIDASASPKLTNANVIVQA